MPERRTYTDDDYDAMAEYSVEAARLSGVWNPPTFAVGDRVRILARPECFYCREDHDAEVGETGTVTGIYPPMFVEDDPVALLHVVWVEFDDPAIVDRTLSHTQESHFAPSELVQLAEETNP